MFIEKLQLTDASRCRQIQVVETRNESVIADIGLKWNECSELSVLCLDTVNQLLQLLMLVRHYLHIHWQQYRFNTVVLFYTTMQQPDFIKYVYGTILFKKVNSAMPLISLTLEEY